MFILFFKYTSNQVKELVIKEGNSYSPVHHSTLAQFFKDVVIYNKNLNAGRNEGTLDHTQCHQRS